jgi:peptidyl-prolyl cis-trans isomerase A (cyclophilin A)
MTHRLIAALALILSATSAAAQTPIVPAPPTTATAPAPRVYATVRVILTTPLGPITLELEKERAPITSANFLRYVDQKRFDGIAFYRRSQAPGEPTKGFIQGGTTDPKRVLPPIAHESTTKTGLSHVQWAISVPRWAPGSARGDFTILLSDAKWMDADPKAPGDNLGYAVFGRVVDGFDTVRKILAAPVSATKGLGAMKGEMLEPQVKITTARRVR